MVGIFVEGLDADYIHLLRDNFGKDGFNRFIKDGVSIENIDYGTDVDVTAATAILMTGASPSVNGIPAARAWDTETRSDYPILLDPANIGNFTDETFSPGALKVSTLSDEVRIADGGLGVVHSVAPDAQVAILLAGHAGNSGFWLNEFSGKWSTSTYYRDVPAAIAARNYGVTLSSRLDTISWVPSRAVSSRPKKFWITRSHIPTAHICIQNNWEWNRLIAFPLIFLKFIFIKNQVYHPWEV